MAIPGLDYKRTKPNVIKAAEYFAPRHGITRVGGWRAVGSVPGSAHPDGLALDFMTRDKAKGDALANDLITNHKAWGITQVIWWRRIWTPAKGWHAYTGPVAHTDHVHATFSANGSVPDTGGTIVPVGNPLIPDSVEKAARFLSDPAVWRKAAFFVGGSALILVGLLMLIWNTGAVKTTVKTAAKAVKVAGKVKGK